MIYLSTSDSLRIRTSTAAALDVYVTYTDAAGAATSGRLPTKITSSTTTVISELSSVANNRQKYIEFISIVNTSAGASNVATLEFFDGTTAHVICIVSLSPKERLTYSDGRFIVYDATGLPKTSTGTVPDVVESLLYNGDTLVFNGVALTYTTFGSGGGSGTTPNPSVTPHTHPLSDLLQSSALTGQVPVWNGTAWVASTAPGTTAPRFTHTQASAATSWTVNHNLGYRPTVTIFSAGGVEVEAGILHTTLNQVQLSFNVAVSGTATFL